MFSWAVGTAQKLHEPSIPLRLPRTHNYFEENPSNRIQAYKITTRIMADSLVIYLLELFFFLQQMDICFGVLSSPPFRK